MSEDPGLDALFGGGRARPDAPWGRPSPRLLAARRAQCAAGGVVLTLGMGLLGAVTGGAAAALALAVLAVLLALAAYWFARRRYVAWGYLERGDDLLVLRGVMFRRLSVVPYGRMQFVDVSAGPVERFFGLATVRLHTAAAATDARIPGLAAGDARRLRDRLAELGEARSTGL